MSGRNRLRHGTRLRLAVAGVVGSILFALPVASHAQVTTWTSANTGGSQVFWSDASRWAGFTIPSATTTTVNFFADTSTLIGNVRATNNAATDTAYSVLNSVTVNGQGTNSGTSVLTMDGTGITYASPATLTFNSLRGSGGGLTVAYGIATTYNGGGTISATNSTAQINYSSLVLGSGDIAVSGPASTGTLSFTGGQTSRGVGDTTITGGLVEARTGGNNNQFGTSNNQRITVQSGGRLLINPTGGAATNSPAIILNGNGFDGLGALASANVGNEYNLVGGVVINTDSIISTGTGGALKVRNFGANRGLAGAGNLTKTGAGVFSVQVAPSAFTIGSVTYPIFSGNIAVNQGTLEIGGASNMLGSSASQTVTMSAGTVLQNIGWNAAYNIPQTLVINGTGSGTGALNIQNVNFGNFNIGALRVASNASINIAQTGGSARTANILGGISGSGDLVKNGDIILSLPSSAQNSSFTGNITVNAGRITGNAGGGSGVNVLGNGNNGLQTITIAPNAQVWFVQGNGSYGQAQNFTVNSDGTFGQTGGLVFTGLNFGSASIGSLGSDTGGSVFLGLDGSVATVGNSSVVPTRGLYGAGKITKYGTATLAINQTGTFTGDLLVASGIVSLGGGKGNVLGTNASGTQAVTVAASGQILLDNGNGAYSQPQTFVLNGTGTGALTGALVVNNINFGSNTLLGLNVASDATVAINPNGAAVASVGTNITSPLAGAGMLTKIGNGVLYLNGANGTFTGNLTVNAGVVQLAGVTNPLGANAAGTQWVSVASTGGVVVNGAGVAPQSFSIVGTGTGIAPGALAKSGGGTYSVGSVTLTGAASIGVASGVLSVSNTLTGSATLTKTGAGTLLVGPNVASPFTGNINVAAGALQINVNNSLGSTANTVTVTGGALVTATNLFAQRTYPQNFVINGNGTGSGAMIFNGMDNFGGNTTLGGLTVASDSSVSFTRHTNGNNNPNTGVRVLSPLAGSGNLSLNGNATLYLTAGTGTFTGDVTINGGLLELASVSNALGSNVSGTQNVTVNSGTGVNLNSNGVAPQTFVINGNGSGTNNSGGALSQYGGGTYVIGSVNLNSDATMSVGTTGVLQVGGAVSGGGSLTKVGTGTLALTGNNSSTGPVQVSGGALAVGAGGTNGALGSGDVTVGTGGSLNFNRSNSLAVANNIIGDGTLAAINGTTTLSGSLTGFTGNIQVSGTSTNLTTTQPLGPAAGSLVVAGPGASFVFSLPANSSSRTTLATLNSINVAPTAALQIVATSRNASNASVLVTSAVSLNGDTGYLDVGNNDVIVKGAGAPGAGDLAFSVFEGRTNPGTGIGSSSGELYRTPAVFLNDAGDGTPYFSSYDGIAGLNASDVIVKYTYIGDTNLDGVLDGQDLANVIEGYSTGQSGWASGDVDHSGGAVSGADLSLFLTAYDWYLTQSGPTDYGNGQGLSTGGGSVPEPTTACLLVAPMIGLVRRRRAK